MKTKHEMIICSVNDQGFAGRMISYINRTYALAIPSASDTFKPGVFSSGEFDPNFLMIAREVYLCASPDPQIPPGELMNRLLSAAQAAYDAGAESVNCIVPDLPFARADKAPSQHKGAAYEKNKGRGRVALAQAKALSSVGIKKVITVDIHSSAVESFYREHFGDGLVVLDTNPMIADHLSKHEGIAGTDGSGIVLVAPDKGIRSKTEDLLSRLHDKGLRKASALFISKTRKDANDPSQVVVELDQDDPHTDNFSSLSGRYVFIMDDMIDTAGTFSEASSVIKDKGIDAGKGTEIPKGLIACFTHPVLAGKDHREPMLRLEQAGLSGLLLFNTHPFVERCITPALSSITTIFDTTEMLGKAIIEFSSSPQE